MLFVQSRSLPDAVDCLANRTAAGGRGRVAIRQTTEPRSGQGEIASNKDRRRHHRAGCRTTTNREEATMMWHTTTLPPQPALGGDGTITRRGS